MKITVFTRCILQTNYWDNSNSGDDEESDYDEEFTGIPLDIINLPIYDVNNALQPDVGSQNIVVQIDNDEIQSLLYNIDAGNNLLEVAFPEELAQLEFQNIWFEEKVVTFFFIKNLCKNYENSLRAFSFLRTMQFKFDL